MKIAFLIIKIILFFYNICYVYTSINFMEQECPPSSFIGCIIKLKMNGVTFHRNIASVIYSIDSEVKLLRTCRSYTDAMSCFREKIAVCGNQKQKRNLNQVGKALTFMCSPFSLRNQEILISKGKCMSKVLDNPVMEKCATNEPKYNTALKACTKNCDQQKNNVMCHMRTWISTQNICTTLEIKKQCGIESALFYTEFQSVVFEPSFPVVCDSSEPYYIKTKEYPKTDISFSKRIFTTTPSTVISTRRRYFNDRTTTSQQPRFVDFLKDKTENYQNLIDAIKINQSGPSENLVLNKIFPNRFTKDQSIVVTTEFTPVENYDFRNAFKEQINFQIHPPPTTFPSEPHFRSSQATKISKWPLHYQVNNKRVKENVENESGLIESFMTLPFPSWTFSPFLQPTTTSLPPPLKLTPSPQLNDDDNIFSTNFPVVTFDDNGNDELSKQYLDDIYDAPNQLILDNEKPKVITTTPIVEKVSEKIETSTLSTSTTTKQTPNKFLIPTSFGKNSKKNIKKELKNIDKPKKGKWRPWYLQNSSTKLHDKKTENTSQFI